VTNGDEAWERLLAGNDRFVTGRSRLGRRDDVRRADKAEHQAPFAVVLGCADSRVPPEIVFDEGIGNLFSVRVAGNAANTDAVLGSIEYGAVVLKCVLVVVLGHEQCGAVRSTIDLLTEGKGVPGHIESLLQPIVPAVEAVRDRPEGELWTAAIRENVHRQVELVKTSQPILARLTQASELKVVGAEYTFETGRVDLVTRS
jgi:carbonic anhydrase